jgi:20S proteasome alpha/beta subunit
VYPWKSKEKRMTIAAGFVCREGVLLCGDTEQSGWAMKLHDAKVDHFEHPGGKIAYAYAGNVPFALAAIQKLQKHLQRRPFADTMGEIEKILDREYRRNVLKHPDHATDGSITYRILLGVWSPRDKVKLYATSHTAIEEVKGYQCVGAGDYLAHYLIRKHVASGIPQAAALAHAAYALSVIKDFVPDCGGMSIYILLEHDGRVGVLTSIHPGRCSEIQQQANAHDFMARELLAMMADADRDDSHIEEYLLKTFVPRLLDVKKKWTRARKDRESAFKDANRILTDEQVKRAFREIELGLLPTLP